LSKGFIVLSGVLVLACAATLDAYAEELNKTSLPSALQAGVELNVKLPALDASLTPGNKFNLEAATTLLNNNRHRNQWYKVPHWAAGRWHESKAVTVYYRDDINGEESDKPHPYNFNSNFNIGTEDDTSKQIWGFADANYWTTTETENRYCYMFVTSLQPLLHSEETCSFRGLSVSFIVDKMTNRIITCKQRETVQIYENVSESRMRNCTCHRVFNWDGVAELSATNESDCNRISKYRNLGNEKAADGRVLHPMFVEYLRSHDMGVLIP
jgi:hypothetical protein